MAQLQGFNPRACGARCDECPLNGQQAVPPETRPDAKIAIVGDYPGDVDVKQLRPLVGPAGSEFDRGLRAAGLHRGNVHITNAVLCRPPEGDMDSLLQKLKRERGPDQAAGPTPAECCAPRLKQELARFQDVIAMGRMATHAMLNNTASILSIRGAVVETEASTRGPKRRVMPTLHPSFVMKQQRWAHVFRGDMQKAVRWFRGDAGWQEPSVRYHPTPAELREFLSHPDRLYTYDVETDGIECLSANVRCIAIGDTHDVMVVGFRSIARPKEHEGLFLDFYDPDEAAEVLAVLRAFFTDPSVTKVGHNSGYYDRIVVRERLGCDVAPNLDTMLLHKSVESELPHSLAYVASMYTTAPAWKQDREGNKLALGGESDAELHLYCARDVAVTARVLSPLVDAVITRKQQDVLHTDLKMQEICAAMHTVGMFVDQEFRHKKEIELLSLRHRLLSEIRERCGRADFNPASIYHMRDLLFTRWGLSVENVEEEDRYTESGDLSTGDLILRSLLTDPSVPAEQRDVIKLIRRYRKALKVLGTYVVKMRPSNMGADLGWDDDEDWVDRETRKKYGEVKVGIVNPRTGRMYPGYNAHVAVTGRLSSSKPMNAQNVPKGLRAMVIAQPGHVLVGADMDQLELRIAAARWGAELYLRAFTEGKDPHSMTAFAVFGTEFCKAAGVDPVLFDRPGILVGDAYENGKFTGGGDAKSMRDLSKAVQYASVGREEHVVVLDARRSVPISAVQPGDWTWAWSAQRKRYEPARVKHVWCHGVKECVDVTFRWNAPKRGGWQQGTVRVTPDHPMLLRDARLRHAGSLRAGDRLLPFYRGTHEGYPRLRPFNTPAHVDEHRVVMGFYEAGQRGTHVHHADRNPKNNHPDNLSVESCADHYAEHKADLDAGRVRSAKWLASVQDAETRSAASKKAWEGRRARRDSDKAFGPRGSKIDAHADKVGVLTDDEVAALAGCTSTLVGMYRKAHNIAPPPRQKGFLRWLLANEVVWNRLLHDKTDTEMVELVNAQFGCDFTASAVHKTRVSLGVPAVSKARRGVCPRRGSKLDAFAERVGHVPDKELAAQAGCTPEAVAYYRKTRGVPAYWREAPEGTNHEVVSITPAGAHEVWDIEVEHEDHNFALAAGIFVHNSQYMAAVETVHKLIQKTELPALDPETKKPIGDGITDLPYAKLPLRRVRMMRDNWLKGAPEFEQGWTREIEAYRRQGFLTEDVGGRRRDFLDGEAPNEIVNFPIQSTAAALMNRALIRLFEEIPLHKWGPGTGIINQCHDSIVVECPESEGPRVAALLEECMNQEHPALPGVRITATATIGRTWKEVG